MMIMMTMTMMMTMTIISYDFWQGFHKGSQDSNSSQHSETLSANGKVPAPAPLENLNNGRNCQNPTDRNSQNGSDQDCQKGSDQDCQKGSDQNGRNGRGSDAGCSGRSGNKVSGSPHVIFVSFSPQANVTLNFCHQQMYNISPQTLNLSAKMPQLSDAAIFSERTNLINTL